MDLPGRGSAGRWALAAAVASVTTIAFLPALAGEFVDFDDVYNFTLNDRYRGLGPHQLAWMLGLQPTRHFWGPLSWLTLGIDWTLWGLDPWGYHLTSLLLHAATAVAFFFVAERLLGRATAGVSAAVVRAGAAVAALFWALHPLRVESVAWISERRDVLSGLLLMLSVLAWLTGIAATAAARRRWLALSVAVYALSLLAKPIGMTLPLVLVILDIYPLRRLTLGRSAWAAPGARAALGEKLPFAAVAVLGALIALTFTHEVKGFADYPLWVRPALLGHCLAFSLGKTLLPLGLIPLYEIPARWTPSDARLVIGGLAAAAITAAVVVTRRRWPAPAAAWAAYAIMLAPVSGLAIHGGPQIAADRYSYLPALALALLVGGGVCVLARALRAGMLTPASARLAAGGVVVWLAGLGVLTWQQAGVWRDSVTLWNHAVTFAPDCARCLHGLGVAWYRSGDAHGAVAPLERAVALRPDLPFQADLGLALWTTGRSREAVPHLEIALAQHPHNVQLERRVGAVLIDAGRPEEARARFAALLAARPDDVDALTGLGLALVALGRAAEALAPLEKAATLSPRAPAPRVALARAYLGLGDRARADRQLAIVRALDPGLAERAVRR